MFMDLFWARGSPVISGPSGDIEQHFLAWRQFYADQLRAGIIPLWTPSYLCGVPFVGSFESAVFYPFNLLFLVFSLSTAVNLEVFSHVLMTGFFSYGWAASRGWRPLACLLTACGVIFSGPFFLQVYAGHLSNLCAMSWIPLLFWAVEELTRKISLRWCGWATFAVCMQGLAGHPQYFYYTALMIFIYGLILGSRNPALFKKGWMLGVIYGAGLCLSGPQWLTGIEAVLESARGSLNDFKTSGLFSLPPENFITLFMPDFFGPVGSNQYWGRWYLWDVSLFTGSILLFFCFYDLAKSRLKSLNEFLMIGIAFLMAWGQSTPFFRFLFDVLPGFKSFRGTCKFDIFIALFIALLAGSGFDRLLKNKQLDPRLMKGLISAAFLLAGLGWIIQRSAHKGLAGAWGTWLLSVHWLKTEFALLDPQTLSDFVEKAGLQSSQSLFLFTGTVLIVAGCAWWSRFNSKAVAALGLIAILELFLFARSHRPTFEWGSLSAKFETIQNFYQSHPGDYRVMGTGSDSVMEGGGDIWEGQPMILARYGRFVAKSQGFPKEELFRTSPIFKRFDPVYSLVRLRYLLNGPSEGRVQAFELPFEPFPRVKIFHQYAIVSSADEALSFLLAPGFDFKNRIILEQTPSFIPRPPVAPERVTSEDISVNQMGIQANLSSPGFLLITDNYGLGWKVRSEEGSFSQGLRAEPADGFLRAIPLEAGSYNLKLVYAPDSFRVGLWISLLSWMFYIAILTCVFRRPLPLTIKRK
jgi:hypothetical protein